MKVVRPDTGFDSHECLPVNDDFLPRFGHHWGTSPMLLVYPTHRLNVNSSPVVLWMKLI